MDVRKVAAQKAGLSSREIEVVELLAGDADNHTIATSLCVSVKTVEMHLTSIYQKLRVKNRMQALIWYMKQSPPVGTPQ